MAEEEVQLEEVQLEEVQLEEVSVNEESPEEGSEEKKKGLSKPLLIKIAIAVTILMISAAAGAYFFLGSTDEELESGMEDVSVDMEDEPGAVKNNDEGANSTRFEKIVQGVQEWQPKT